jgi:hypothetical protein
LTVNGSLGPIRFLGANRHNPTNLVAVVQVRNGKFVQVLKSVPKNVPSP